MAPVKNAYTIVNFSEIESPSLPACHEILSGLFHLKHYHTTGEAIFPGYNRLAVFSAEKTVLVSQ